MKNFLIYKDERSQYVPLNEEDFLRYIKKEHRNLCSSSKKISLTLIRNNVSMLVVLGFKQGIALEYIDESFGYFWTKNDFFLENKSLKEKSLVFYFGGHYSEMKQYHFIDHDLAFKTLIEFYNYIPLDFNNGFWEKNM